MRFVYWIEDVFHGVQERHPIAFFIAAMILLLAIFGYVGSMDYEDAQRNAHDSQEMAQQEQHWQEYKEVNGWR